jgi:hypothetical protein
MPERSKGKTLVARDEADDADGVLIKLYGEETNGAISIIEQPFEPGVLLPPHVHEAGTPHRAVHPGGIRAVLQDFGDRLRQGPTGLDELNRLGEPHGIRFFDDWIPDLKAAYDLRVVGE